MTDDTKRVTLAEKLNETLQIEEQTKKQEILKDFISDKDSQDDFDLVRKTIKDMIKRGEEAVEDLAAVAKETETPRHYEVLSNLIKTTTEIAEKLVDIRKKKKDLDKEPDNTNTLIPGTNGTTNVFVGTTDDVLKMIKDNITKKREEPKDVTPLKD